MMWIPAQTALIDIIRGFGMARGMAVDATNNKVYVEDLNRLTVVAFEPLHILME